MVDNKIISQFIELGFSEYEAKAYCSLVLNNPASAYQLAKASLIPTAKIYEVLAKLSEKGLILELIELDKKKYIPIDPEEFIEQYKSRTTHLLTDLKQNLLSLTKKDEVSYIWNIKEYNYLLDKAKSIIASAEKTLLISLWQEEMRELHTDFEMAVNKKIQTAIIHFGPPEYSVGQVFQHPIEHTIYKEKMGRGLVVIADSQEVLMGTIFENRTVEGAFSRNKGFVTMAEDYVKHDVYIMKIVKRFNEELIRRFGDNYKLLRDIFNDKEFT